MSFSEYLDQAWNDHATDSARVAETLQGAVQLAQNDSEISQLAQLATHVFGEHLAQWQRGVEFLSKLNDQCSGDGARALARCIAALEMGQGTRSSVDEFSISDRVRILAVASSALSAQGQGERARELFSQSLGAAQAGLTDQDPAYRALAVSANNLACALEEKSARSAVETDLMILAAKSARKYWEIAGGWCEVERAEYRLAQTYLRAGDLAQAMEHARACLKISSENSAPALELFFGFEALAQVERARGNEAGFKEALEQIKLKFAELSADEKSWCEPSLQKLLQP